MTKKEWKRLLHKLIRRKFCFRFSRAQIRRLYRGFKSECPSGILTEECFHYVYSSFFPGREMNYTGTICSFTHYLYSLMENQQGFITFEVIGVSLNDYIFWLSQDFLTNLSIIVTGSDEEKYNWIFDLYDLNGDGFISKEEMEDVAHSVRWYEENLTIGNSQNPKSRSFTLWTLGLRTSIILLIRKCPPCWW